MKGISIQIPYKYKKLGEIDRQLNLNINYSRLNFSVYDHKVNATYTWLQLHTFEKTYLIYMILSSPREAASIITAKHE